VLATGGLLVSIALLAIAALAPVFRSSNPPQWTTRGWVGEVVTIATVSTLAIGLGYLGAGVIDAVQTGPDYLDLGLLAVVLFGSLVIWRRLRARARPNAPAADQRLHSQVPASRGGHGDGARAAAEGARGSAGAPAPPHKAA